MLECPECETSSLHPGTVEGAEMWYCTPCNGFLVDRSLLMGEPCADGTSLDMLGFRRNAAPAAGNAATSDPHLVTYIGRVLQRLVFRTGSAQ